MAPRPILEFDMGKIILKREAQTFVRPLKFSQQNKAELFSGLPFPILVFKYQSMRPALGGLF